MSSAMYSHCAPGQRPLLTAVMYVQLGDVSEWISSAPKWCDAGLKENLNPTKKRKRDDTMDDMIPISQKNCLYIVWKYRKEKLVLDPKCDQYSDIGDVILHMLDSYKYYLDPGFARTGLPDFYIDIFKSSCKEGRLTFHRDKKQTSCPTSRTISEWEQATK